MSNLKPKVHKLGIDELKNVPANWGNLKSKVDHLAVHELVLVPVDLNKLTDAAQNGFFKKCVYNVEDKKYWRWNTWYY